VHSIQQDKRGLLAATMLLEILGPPALRALLFFLLIWLSHTQDSLFFWFNPLVLVFIAYPVVLCFSLCYWAGYAPADDPFSFYATAASLFDSAHSLAWRLLYGEDYDEKGTTTRAASYGATVGTLVTQYAFDATGALTSLFQKGEPQIRAGPSWLYSTITGYGDRDSGGVSSAAIASTTFVEHLLFLVMCAGWAGADSSVRVNFLRFLSFVARWFLSPDHCVFAFSLRRNPIFQLPCFLLLWPFRMGRKLMQGKDASRAGGHNKIHPVRTHLRAEDDRPDGNVIRQPKNAAVLGAPAAEPATASTNTADFSTDLPLLRDVPEEKLHKDPKVPYFGQNFVKHHVPRNGTHKLYLEQKPWKFNLFETYDEAMEFLTAAVADSVDNSTRSTSRVVVPASSSTPPLAP
ncbi:unnamed protein product, partial [Amoebophrya sp. A120]